MMNAPRRSLLTGLIVLMTTALGLAGAQVLRDIGAHDGENAETGGDVHPGENPAVALRSEGGCAQLGDHPRIDELLEGIRHHRGHGGRRDGHQLNQRRPLGRRQLWVLLRMQWYWDPRRGWATLDLLRQGGHGRIVVFLFH